jgi:hypothetical protein
MRIGVDFDNTIVCYDEVFHRAAVTQQLVPAGVPKTKAAVRDHLRRSGQEDRWVELQGYAYGPGMRHATPFPGVIDFFAACAARDITAYIISHRTRYPFRGPRYDLHAAAQQWLARHGFYEGDSHGLSPEQVHFELSKEDKLRRIARVGCDRFVDDLPEFLAEPGFPIRVERVLFDPEQTHDAADRWLRVTSWRDLALLLH